MAVIAELEPGMRVRDNWHKVYGSLVGWPDGFNALVQWDDGTRSWRDYRYMTAVGEKTDGWLETCR